MRRPVSPGSWARETDETGDGGAVSLSHALRRGTVRRPWPPRPEVATFGGGGTEPHAPLRPIPNTRNATETYRGYTKGRSTGARTLLARRRRHSRQCETCDTDFAVATARANASRQCQNPPAPLLRAAHRVLATNCTRRKPRPPGQIHSHAATVFVASAKACDTDFARRDYARQCVAPMPKPAPRPCPEPLIAFSQQMHTAQTTSAAPNPFAPGHCHWRQCQNLRT